MNRAEPRVLVSIAVAKRAKRSCMALKDTGRFRFEQTGHPPCLNGAYHDHIQTGGRPVA